MPPIRLRRPFSRAALVLVSAIVTAPGPSVALDLSTIELGTGGFVMNGEQAAASAGERVAAAGDVNGDGVGDMLVGAPWTDIGAVTNAGRVFVVFGRSTGSAVSLSTFTNQQAGGFVIDGEAPNGMAGYGVAGVGDVNGDGMADIAVAAPFATSSGGAVAGGRAYVVFGKPTSSRVMLSAVTMGVGGFAIASSTTNQRLGTSVTGLGDMNGDGLADLALSAYRATLPAGAYAGRVFVVFGKGSTSPVLDGDLVAGTGGFVVNGEGFNHLAGRSVGGGGDVNGDGWPDLLVGAPGVRSNGAGYVVWGRTQTTPVELSAVALGTGGFVIIGASTGDAAGFPVANAGDINGDGLADVAIVAPNADPWGLNAAGSVYVVLGRSAATPVFLSAVAAGTGGFVVTGTAEFENACNSVAAAGDWDGDGLDDVVLGNPRADQAWGTNAGEASLVLGRTATTPLSLSGIAAGTGGWCLRGAALDDQAGFSVSGAGDMTGDGLPELLVGAWLAEPPSSPANVGCAYAVFSAPAVVPSATYAAFLRPGWTFLSGIGSSLTGDNTGTVLPNSRLWLSMAGGTGSGTGGSSAVQVTLTRTKAGVGGVWPGRMADVRWTLSTDRTDWTSGMVMVQYTPGEVAGLQPSALALFGAPTEAGPFVALPNPINRFTRRQVMAEIHDAPVCLILVDTSPPTPTILRLLTNPTTEQNPSWSVVFDRPVGNSFSVDDITPTGTRAGDVALARVTGADPTYVVQLFASDGVSEGTLGFDLAAGAVVDELGIASTPATAPPYTIDEIGAGLLPGDVNRDAVVNVEDVTVLADHIVNGTPLP